MSEFNSKIKANKVKLEEGIHFYYDKGLMVLTEAYHLERGYCCGNGCRHCPYPKTKETKK